MSEQRLSYTLLDVFCLPGKPFTGNQLAVVHGTQGLGKAQLQAIAKEFNLSETAFPLPPGEGDPFDYSVRIFTIAEEFPFAGHPSLGSAWSMRDTGVIPAGKADAVQSCPYGHVKISFPAENPNTVELSSPPSFVAPIENAPSLNAALSLDKQSLKTLSLHRASCGLEFIYVRAAEDSSVVDAKPAPAEIRRFLDSVNGADGKAVAIVLFSVDTSSEQPAKIHQRVFPTDFEDPATGSASLALGLVLLHIGILPRSGASGYTIRQGAEIGRPSAITGRVVASDGQAQECWVGGEVVKIGEGWIRVPLAE